MTAEPVMTFDEHGLVPAVVQDWRDGTVLMVGFMDREALDYTIKTKQVHFWSRSRKTLWKKGERSGHVLSVKELFIDCDRDTVLVKAEPVGPTCHTGQPSCFFSKLGEAGEVATEPSDESLGGILEHVYRTILARKDYPSSGSYVSALLESGHDRILKKIIEEAGEVLLGSKNNRRDEIVYEVADLFFHVVVALGYHAIPLEEVYRELARRTGTSGLRPEKGRRPDE